MESIKTRASNPEAHSNCGVIFCTLQQYDKAIASFDESIRLKRDFVKAYHNKATALYEMEKYKESVDMFDKAIRVFKKIFINL
jgi:tetratricopeptide (TPR) repeat protein